MCPECGSTGVQWKEAPEQGSLFSFTIVRHATHPAVESCLPYVVGLVEFDGLPNVRLISNITDIEASAVRIGMKLQCWWDDLGENQYLPRFRPLSDENEVAPTARAREDLDSSDESNKR